MTDSYAQALARDDAPLRGRAVVLAEYRGGVRAAWTGPAEEMRRMLGRLALRTDVRAAQGFMGQMVKGAKVL